MSPILVCRCVTAQIEPQLQHHPHPDTMPVTSKRPMARRPSTPFYMDDCMFLADSYTSALLVRG
jgi:hypothetical protein